MSALSSYDRFPIVACRNSENECVQGWDELLSHLQARISADVRTLVLECYPGVKVEPLLDRMKAAFPQAMVMNVEQAYRCEPELEAMLGSALGDDPVFGWMQRWGIEQFFDATKLEAMRTRLAGHDGLRIVAGAGAAYVEPAAELLLYAGVTRWELQRRQRAGEIGDLGRHNAGAAPGLLYKNAFFVDWRVGDAVRESLYARVAYFVDLDDPDEPRMLAGDVLRTALEACVRGPFRVEPFFDPGPWGGQWMRRKFGLPDGPANYAWCFDCVPEENALVLGFGARRFRMPSAILVQQHPRELLGADIFRRFGAEFPIRFDLLDTVEGGNLSLQVHPLTAYIREHFGMGYTQDESYYILDCEAGAELYLGLKTGVSPEGMRRGLEAAQRSDGSFAAEEYVNVLPTRRHDHFAIPAGTVHCSGSGNLVLEVSATPYIFTFKLWDWGRLGLDGRPRPIHLEHGLANIQWDRDTAWVERELLDQTETLNAGDGWREERTGLHALEFIETRRTWFTSPVEQDTAGTLHVLNLVEGDAALVESPDGAFAPFEVHYAETFIVPAAVGRYSVRPLGEGRAPLAILRASVRPEVLGD